MRVDNGRIASPLEAQAMVWPRLSPLGVLAILIAVLSALQACYIALGVPMSPEFQQLGSFGLALAFALWIVVDARSRRIVPAYDFGFLVLLSFPVSLVWYLFWSRGVRGLLLLGALVGLSLVPWASAIAVWVARYGL